MTHRHSERRSLPPRTPPFARHAGAPCVDRNSTLPMFGAVFVQDLGRAALKLRVAYGKGIRPAETTIRTTSWMGMRGSEGASNLSPEEQSGVEAGVDLLVGRTLGFHLTRFDQLASGLIQPVAVSSSGPGPGGGGDGGSDGSGPDGGGGGLTMAAASLTSCRTSARSRIAAGRSPAPLGRTACPFPRRMQSSTVAFVVLRIVIPETSGRGIACSKCRSAR